MIPADAPDGRAPLRDGGEQAVCAWLAAEVAALSRGRRALWRGAAAAAGD